MILVPTFMAFSYFFIRALWKLTTEKPKEKNMVELNHAKPYSKKSSQKTSRKSSG